MNTALMLMIGVSLAGMILFLWPCLFIAAQSDLRMEEIREDRVQQRPGANLEE